ncbi:MAG: NAD-dependent epimerase/dehydratase family protein [Dehalococcoidales bacterium]|nr:NAD-dependent epimerase/dehydratase family protein [Dehalococcoidales bacterium]
MTVVVTGASGHLGSNLVRALVAEKRPVRALVHINRQTVEGLGAEIVSANITDVDSLCRAFEGAEVVYHLAATISLLKHDWHRVAAVNVIGTRNVVDACLKCGVKRLVHFSSIHAFVQTPYNMPVDESRSLVESRQYPPYDRSKAAGEKEVRKGIEKGLDAVIINPTAIIGPYDYQPSHFGAALLSMANGKMVALIDGGFDWVDVRDVVKGAMTAEKQAPTGSKYLLSGHWVSMCEMAEVVKEITGASIPGFICPTPLAMLGAPVATAFNRLLGRRPLYTTVALKALNSNHNISHEKATRELGYQPRPFRETITDTLKWFGENGKLKCRLKVNP